MEKTVEQKIKIMEVLYGYDFHGNTSFLDFQNLDSEIKLVVIDIISKLELIDQTIESNMVNYTISRLNKVDLAIIRLSVYDLLNKIEPAEKVINFAIELTKAYSDMEDEKQHKFTNKVLDNIFKNL